MKPDHCFPSSFSFRRVKLSIDAAEPSLRKILFSFDCIEIGDFSELASAVCRQLNILRSSAGVDLEFATPDGFLIPPWTRTLVVKDDEEMCVRFVHGEDAKHKADCNVADGVNDVASAFNDHPEGGGLVNIGGTSETSPAEVRSTIAAGKRKRGRRRSKGRAETLMNDEDNGANELIKRAKLFLNGVDVKAHRDFGEHSKPDELSDSVSVHLMSNQTNSDPAAPNSSVSEEAKDSTAVISSTGGRMISNLVVKETNSIQPPVLKPTKKPIHITFDDDNDCGGQDMGNDVTSQKSSPNTLDNISGIETDSVLQNGLSDPETQVELIGQSDRLAISEKTAFFTPNTDATSPSAESDRACSAPLFGKVSEVSSAAPSVDVNTFSRSIHSNVCESSNTLGICKTVNFKHKLATSTSAQPRCQLASKRRSGKSFGPTLALIKDFVISSATTCAQLPASLAIGVTKTLPATTGNSQSPTAVNEAALSEKLKPDTGDVVHNSPYSNNSKKEIVSASAKRRRRRKRRKNGSPVTSVSRTNGVCSDTRAKDKQKQIDCVGTNRSFLVVVNGRTGDETGHESSSSSSPNRGSAAKEAGSDLVGNGCVSVNHAARYAAGSVLQNKQLLNTATEVEDGTTVAGHVGKPDTTGIELEPGDSVSYKGQSIMSYTSLQESGLQAGIVVAYKLLEISDNCQPSLTGFIISRVISYDRDSAILVVEIIKDCRRRLSVQGTKLAQFCLDDQILDIEKANLYSSGEEKAIQEQLSWHMLHCSKLLEKSYG